ncbi:MAG: 23S rRNA (adenine(2503)-C(2))-methyltransferase RlmN [Proteobacteria bacterium]|nr:23S rRNA (adenine(2503)-C(2))-methyltransferase RlmN [Pseudomonadota bacterium]
MKPLPDLRSLPLATLEQLAAELGQPRFRALQLFGWIHRRGATSVAAMTNLPRELREHLASSTTLAPLEVAELLESADGTRKLRLRCVDGASIESVLIPRETKRTLCISSQVGCALGCSFCATATMGLKRNLTAGEIVDQVYRVNALLPADERLTNLVFMGMGEPLVNVDAVVTAIALLCAPEGLDLSPRRITVSTAGVVPGIRELGRRMRQVGLAISLHATTDEVRDRLMPINRRWPLAALFAALRAYPLPRRRRITFEYLLLPGVNDSAGDVTRLCRLLEGIPSKVNLLPYNPSRSDQPELRRPDDEALETFAELLRARGLTATVRHSRGLDIAAACGQLVVASGAAKALNGMTATAKIGAGGPVLSR